MAIPNQFCGDVVRLPSSQEDDAFVYKYPLGTMLWLLSILSTSTEH